jgi:hypothetical protein
VYEIATDALVQLLEGGKLKAAAVLTQGKFKWKPRPAARPAKAPVRRAPKKGPPRRAGTGPRAAAPPAPAPAPPPAPTGKRRMTPLYSIPVSNELFHNGNVEAWKKVIQSYNHKHPGLEVFIFYEGERIHDINTLFKWGKVKHGSTIMIAVAGEEVRDVAKLQRYLRQGASPAFEAFLKFPVNTVLNLF